MKPEESSRSRRAAAYVRMSTEHQQYSTSNQMDVINVWAASRGMIISKTYSDEGKSGLSLRGRHGLSQMISDVLSDEADYSCILIYDISRWGRFQDADESAHLEYLCKSHGVVIHYCAEQFENDGSVGSTLIKSVKRTMSGEYSRELSCKVFQGACKLINLGYKQGGTAGFGLRRMLVDHLLRPKGELKMGEHKSIQTDRVILVPGPDDEVAVVRWMYDSFVKDGLTESEIAASLNKRQVLTDFGRPWTRGTVHEVLTNEKYIGNNVYCRTSFKLKQRHVSNPPEKWIRLEGAFKGIIENEVFCSARNIILARSQKLSDDEMLNKLRALLQAHGRVSGILIDEDDNAPSSSAFRHRFGSLVKAYRLIGYTPEVDYAFIEINKILRKRHPEIMSAVIADLRQHGADVVEHSNSFVINGEILVSIVLARCKQTLAGGSRWMIHLDQGVNPDITIAVRMDETNSLIHDYYLLPSIDMEMVKLRLAEENGISLDTYQFDSLDRFFEMARRIDFKNLL